MFTTVSKYGTSIAFFWDTLYNWLLRYFIFKPISARGLSLVEDRSTGSSPVCLVEDCKVRLCTENACTAICTLLGFYAHEGYTRILIYLISCVQLFLLNSYFRYTGCLKKNAMEIQRTVVHHKLN